MKPSVEDLRQLARDLQELDDWLADPNHAADGIEGIAAGQLADRVHAWAVDAELAEAKAMISAPEPEPVYWRLTKRLTSIEIMALSIYVFDPAHDPEPFPGRMSSNETLAAFLEVPERDFEAARAWLTEAANSADESKDRQSCDALTKLAARLPRA